MESHLEIAGHHHDVLEALKDLGVFPFRRNVSGTYKNATPAGIGTILELRADVDGRRPQQRLSGDIFFHFHFCGPITLYIRSFVVETLTIDDDPGEMTISGPVVYYEDPTNTSDSIRVHIPRVSSFAPAPAACVEWLTRGQIVATYACPKISEYFRIATLEIDRFQGTVFPPELDPDVDPSPSGLPSSVGVRSVFQRTGIDLTVHQDDLLNDPDSGDPGDNWSEAELHDLMEDRFDLFADTLQWKTYGVIVPRFGDPTYNSGYYGTMFDWGGWQTGDTFFRQGCALAEEATRGREVGTLYDTSDKKDRLLLETFIHEVGHSFNLPHSWSRGTNADSASESYMNYPWGYTGGSGGETAFWENFRWEFDDVELVWMRHGNRRDVIFGGRDWIGNNLSAYSRAEIERSQSPLELTVESADVFDFGVPVTVQLGLVNASASPASVVDQLQPEDGLTRVFIERPNGDIVEFVPPVLRHKAPPELRELAPGEAAYESILLSFGAKGHQFADPGEYLIRIFVPCYPFGYMLTRAHRIRIAAPATRASENLAHLLTGYPAAKFIYFGGSRRYPEVAAELEEAVDRYAETDPLAVRHIEYALGRDAARKFKSVGESKGQRVVVVAKDPDLRKAVRHFEAARAPVKGRDEHAFDPLTLAEVATRLAASHVELGQRAKATTVLEETANELKSRSAPVAAVEKITQELATVKKPSRRKA